MTRDAAYVPVIHAARPDRPDEQDAIDTAAEVARALVRLGYDSEAIDIGADPAALHALAARRPAAVFNMVETVAGDPTRADQPVRLMQALGLRFTGCDANALTAALSKCASKRRMSAFGIPTPPWWEAGDEIPAGTRVIVKSDSEHASWGIDPGSVVRGAWAAAEIAAREAKFGGRFFAEAYIAGREFNVALLQDAEGVRVLPIPEILFDALPDDGPKIVDYAAKWDRDSYAYRNTPRRFGLEAQDPALAAELARHALACWHAFGLSGYARIDFRVDENRQPFVLEVNTNPCLAPDAGFAATADAAGLSYDALIAKILAAALMTPATAARHAA